VRSLYPQEAKRPQKKEKAFSPPSAETRRPLTTTLLRIECSAYPRRSRSVTDTACARLLGGHSGTLAQASPPILALVKSAWLNLRASRYFIGPYSDTPDFTILGPPPYHVLPEGGSPEELGRTIRLAIAASSEERTSGDEHARLAAERILELAQLAGVKDRRTFERGARLVDFDVRTSGEILVTPSFRKRGYWEPSPESQWIRLIRPSDADLGHAAIEAAARSTS
jgi:hypothetical protein